MPVAGGLRQGALQPGPDPLRAVVRDPGGLGDDAGGLEPDPPHLRRQPVRLVLHDRDGGTGVLFVDPHGQRRGHPDTGQEHHHFLDRLLLLPGVGDLLGPFRPQSVHLGQPAGLLFDDGQDVGAEMRHHPLGHHRADPLDQPGPQVGADALDRGRQHGRIGVDLELPAIGGVAAPASGQAQALPDLGAQQRPCHRQQIRAGPLGGHPGDGATGVLVDVGDPFQHRLQHRQAMERIGRERLAGRSRRPFCRHPQPGCAARQASQPSGRSLPRPGTARPAARAHTRTSAVEGSGAPGAGRARPCRCWGGQWCEPPG